LKALIFGITGQDGILLSDFLIKKNYQVTGTSRKPENSLNLSINSKVNIVKISKLNYKEISEIVYQVMPDEIYNLCGLTSVGKSIEYPLETYQSIVQTTLYILESIRLINKKIKFFNPSSTECYGNVITKKANETNNFNPLSPYATAKVMSHYMANNYKLKYDMFVCTGILSNHESFLRPIEFVSKKIIQGAYKISQGIEKELEVGDISIMRDWGWAEEYIEAMYLMMKMDKPDDFIIATGMSITLEQFISYAFSKFNLDYKKYIKINKLFMRKNDVKKTILNTQKAEKKLQWKAKLNAFDVIDKLTYGLINP
jgi:GDPmannose 4,6-dehydratase